MWTRLHESAATGWGYSDDRAIQALDYLIDVLTLCDKEDEILELYSGCLNKMRKELGPDHHTTLVHIHNYAKLLVAVDGAAGAREADPLYREAVMGLRDVNGADHPDTTNAIKNWMECRKTLASGAKRREQGRQKVNNKCACGSGKKFKKCCKGKKKKNQ